MTFIINKSRCFAVDEVIIIFINFQSERCTVQNFPRQAKRVFGHMQRRPRSACASAKADQGLRCFQTESLDTIEYFNEELMPG